MAGEILIGYSTPGLSPVGTCLDEKYLWHVDDGTGLVYQIDTNNQTIISSFSRPNLNVQFIFTDRKVLKGGNIGSSLYVFDKKGNLIRTIASPGAGNVVLRYNGKDNGMKTMVGGNTVIGKYAWYDQNYNVLATGGNILPTATGPGLTDRYWVMGSSSSSTMSVINTKISSVIRTFNITPTIYNYQYVDYDGKDTWGIDTITYTFYKVKYH